MPASPLIFLKLKKKWLPRGISWDIVGHLFSKEVTMMEWWRMSNETKAKQ